MMNKAARWLLVVLTLHAAAATADSCQQGETGDGGAWWRGGAAVMGTDIRVELWSASQAEACEAVAAVIDEMRRVDRAMSPWIESSLIARLNREGAAGPVPVGSELYELIDRSLDYSRLTGGAFDITFASAGRYYDYRSGTRPDDATLASSLPAIDFHHLQLSEENHAIAYARAGVHVDLGGIAKGYAVDRCIALLRDRGITDAMVGAGGDTRFIGNRRGEPWVVGVRDPRQAGRSLAVLPLEDIAVSTSGDYERYFEEGGVRYHHIIDPVTGDSARNVQSVTIMAASATATDALSTSVFVLGVERGLELINGLPGVDAVIVDGAGDMHLSDSLLDMTASR